MMINYERIASSFIGCSLDEIQEIAVITNIRPIYSALLQTGRVLFESKNFYSYATVQARNGCVFGLFRITPGNCIVDVVKLVSQRSKRVAFWGIGGAISDDLCLGDVVEITNYCSIDKQGNVLSRMSRSEGKTIAQTDGLIQSEFFYNALKQQYIDLVDMESVDFSNICKQLFLEYHYYIHVSDLPLKIPFYDAKPCPIIAESFLTKFEEWIK